MPGREEGPDAQIPSQRALWNSWHAEATASDDTAEHGRFRQRLLDLIGPGPAAILELACGRGLDASVYAAAGHDVVATDFSPVAIENARRIHGHGGGLIFEVVDHGEPLPFEAGVFDGVVSHLGLHYFDDPTTVAVFAEIRRVLQSGGHLQLLVKSVHDPQYGVGTEIGPDMYLRGNHLRHFFRRDYLEHVADTAGLTVLMVEEYTGLYYGQRNPSSFIFAQLQKL